MEIVGGSAQLCNNALERFGTEVKSHCSCFEDFKPKAQFHNVRSLCVLEHVDNPQDVIRKMHDWVIPGLRVIAVVLNAQSLDRQLAVVLRLQDNNNSLSPRDFLVVHQRVFIFDEIVTFFQKAGFDIIEKFAIFFK